MKIIFGVILSLLLLILGCQLAKEKQFEIDKMEVSTMKLTSSAFQHNGLIPGKYTCDGESVNPPLLISDVPVKAKSLVLLMDDPDIPERVKKNFNIEVWDHWVVFNLPASTTEIKEGEKLQGVLGRNTRGNNSYGGPCPPDREHRYFFKLYALDTMLALKEGATKKEVEKAIVGHVLVKAELMGRYERQK